MTVIGPTHVCQPWALGGEQLTMQCGLLRFDFLNKQFSDAFPHKHSDCHLVVCEV